LARTTAFDSDRLCAARRATFNQHSSVLPRGLPVALANEFAGNPMKLTQWRGLLPEGHAYENGNAIGQVVEFIRGFLLPPLSGGSKAITSCHPATPVCQNLPSQLI
jgi:hypothetical protein